MMAAVGALMLVLAALLWPGPVGRLQGRLSHGQGVGERSGRGRGARGLTSRGLNSGDRRAGSGPPGADQSAYAVAEALLLVAVALRSGCSPVDALHRVASSVATPVATQLEVVVAAHRWGLDARAAWSQVDPVWTPAAAAWIAAEQAGVSPGPLLEAAATNLRLDADARAEAALARAGVHLVLPLGLAFLPGFLLTTIVPVVSGLVPLVLPR